MTKEEATALADNIIRCGDPHIGAGMILGALMMERQIITGMDPRHTISVGTIVVPEAPDAQSF